MEIDFTSAEVLPLRMYGGANGNKIGIMYQNEAYMLKFPPLAKQNDAMHYSNSCISEYVACHIFAALGFETQETLLGWYRDKVAVACKDFETDGFVLKDFAHLKNTIIDSVHNGYGTDLEDVLMAIQTQQIVSVETLESFFWEMFIADAWLGNFDRHNGNWGFLINHNTNEVKLAPIYDCGSCLYPQMDEESMPHIMASPEKIAERVFVFPTSALRQAGKKINYAQFLLETEHTACLAALRCVCGRIDMAAINKVIDNTPFISDTYKAFLKTMLQARKAMILDKAMERLRQSERRATPPSRHSAIDRER